MSLLAELGERGIRAEFVAGTLVSSMAVKDASPRMKAFSLKKISNLAEWLYVIPFRIYNYSTYAVFQRPGELNVGCTVSRRTKRY